MAENEFRLGEVMMFAEKEVCYCADGSPHYHAYQAMWDGQNWRRKGSPEWGKAISDFTRVCDQTGMSEKLRKDEP